MNWITLYERQKQLDEYITANHNLQTSDLINHKILALLVEVGELANETRCFKFWSSKAPSSKTVILEEYVDGLHFILSLGLDLGFRFSLEQVGGEYSQLEAFLSVYSSIERFRNRLDNESYQQMFKEFLTLGETLGFNSEEIQKSYHKKNEVNFERQDQGY